MIEKSNYLYLSYFDGIGPMRYKNLISVFKSASRIISASIKELQEVIGVKIGADFYRFIRTFDAEFELERLEKAGISVVPIDDIRYPKALKEIPDPPICLFAKGNLDSIYIGEKKYFAIVGTRKITPYGKKVARDFAVALAREGIVIVSGLALGIDTAAHTGALEVGATVAVLGCGVDIVYPPSNKLLYEEIIKKGVVMSEFPPGHTVMKGLFVARNRIISGLSSGVLVVEGAEDSGALITARYAAEQGKDVYAIPSPITSVVGFAPNFLIREGAKIVTTYNDILADLGIREPKKSSTKIFINKIEEQIFEYIVSGNISIDDLVRLHNLPLGIVLQTLTSLELQGCVVREEDGLYRAV